MLALGRNDIGFLVLGLTVVALVGVVFYRLIWRPRPPRRDDE